MLIAFIATESTPIAKVGGLADVIFGLTKELLRLSLNPIILMPLPPNVGDLQNPFLFFTLPFAHSEWKVAIFLKTCEGIDHYLFEIQGKESLFNRPEIYGYEDDSLRFPLFCKAAIEFLYLSGKQPSIIHLHDWPVALFPFMIDEWLYPPFQAKFIFTLHNLAYQGRLPKKLLSHWGISKSSSIEALLDPKEPSLLNLVKGALLRADAVSTVSRRYAEEIQTAEFGEGLEAIFQHQKAKLKGIQNGIDLSHFPNEAVLLLEKSPEDFFSYKKEIKKRILRRLSLNENSDLPLAISVTRLVEQKGPHLIEKGAEFILAEGGIYILLASQPALLTRTLFEEFEKRYAESGRIRILFGHEPDLANELLMGADLLLMPSLMEPCGLTQLYALTFGTLPVIREVGGLADTVHDIDTSSLPFEKRNGFTFLYPDEQGVYWALSRALTLFKEKPEVWKQLVQQAKRGDFSWKHPAQEYLSLYEKTLSSS